MSKTHQVQIRMEEEVFLKLKHLADENGLPVATYIRSLLLQYTKGTLSLLDEDALEGVKRVVAPSRPDVTF